MESLDNCISPCVPSVITLEVSWQKVIAGASPIDTMHKTFQGKQTFLISTTCCNYSI